MYIYIYIIYIYIVYLRLYTTWLIRQYHVPEHRRLRAFHSAAALRLCGLRPCAWYDTILSQNMLKLFISPETYRIDFAGMDKNPGFSQEHGGFAGSMLIYQGVLCASVWIFPAKQRRTDLGSEPTTNELPKACYLLVSGLPPQSLSPMLLKDGTGPRPAAYGA